ncbi:hypothetical protein [Paenibacillus spongiae]|uniref:Uncharacterized protein n=1 Tax=Paenibacillus spongiae TaxID=2909671 RepID=A0ABY5SI27_9BACL|nr:hypothetical protein [Paenibacillus spongiae]UVI33110.1 hypothetical protein L1F29_15260 [Paenibacillus spongiae]
MRSIVEQRQPNIPQGSCQQREAVSRQGMLKRRVFRRHNSPLAYIVISLHPQDTLPNVWERIQFSANAINKYDSLKISDLDSIEQDKDPFRNGNSELYVAALYKFKEERSCDSNNLFYSKNKKSLEEKDDNLLVSGCIKKIFT